MEQKTAQNKSVDSISSGKDSNINDNSLAERLKKGESIDVETVNRKKAISDADAASIITSGTIDAIEKEPELKNEINKLSFWEKITLEKELLDTIEEELNFRFSYFLLLISSTLVTTLGLLIDSTAVVIGGMLLAPLFWPILGSTVSIIKIRRKLAEKSFSILAISIAFVIVCSFLVGLVVPITTIPDEVMARVNPTILDLFIALSVSVVGVAAVYYPKVSESATGVAVSISLLPPLCVTGIGLSLGDPVIAGKSFLLFLTNLLAIVVAGAATLYFLEVRPKRGTEKKRFKFSIIATGLVLLILCIPLSFYLFESYNQAKLNKDISEFIHSKIPELQKDARLDTLDIILDDADSVDIKASIYLPEGERFSEAQRNRLIRDLAEITDKDTNLELNILSTLVLTREEDTRKQTRIAQVENEVRNQFMEISSEVIIEGVEVFLPDEGSSLIAKVKVLRYTQDPISLNDKNSIEEKLASILEEHIKVDVEFVPITRLEDYSQIDAERELISNILLLRLSSNFDEFDLEEIEILDSDDTTVSLKAKVYIGIEEVVEDDFKRGLIERIERITGKTIKINLLILRYE